MVRETKGAIKKSIDFKISLHKRIERYRKHQEQIPAFGPTVNTLLELALNSWEAEQEIEEEE